MLKVLSIFIILICNLQILCYELNEKQKIAMIIAKNDFRDEEYSHPRKIFEENGFAVDVYSSSINISIGMLGMKVKPDFLIKDLNVLNYVAIVFVGGVGAQEYWENETAHKIAIEAFKKNKVIGAICLAPGTLAKAKILEGKKATAYISAKDVLKKNGAIWQEKNVVVDGNIVTANGPDAAKNFANEILKLLKNKK